MLGRSVPALAVAIALARFAAGQDAVGPEFRANTFTTSAQLSPSVSSDADGNFVIVWASHGQDGEYACVAGQRFDRLGNPRGTEFVVNSYTASSQAYPSLAVAPAGGFVVAWASYSQDGDSWGIFARRFDASGTPLGLAEFRVNAFTTGEQLHPDIAIDPAGNFVVVWSSYNQDGSTWGVFGRRFDSAGGGLGGEFPVNVYTANLQGPPAVAAAPDGSFVVTWHSAHDGGNVDVFARRFDAAGNALGPEFLVNSFTTAFQSSPDLAMDGSGGFVVVWESTFQDGSDYSVHGQRFGAAGNRLGAEFRVNTYTVDRQGGPSVAVEASGNFVVVWHSNGQEGGTYYNVFGQRFNASGGTVGGEFQINTYTTSSQGSPAVASLGPERFVVSWDSYLQDGDNRGVYAQRYGDLIFRDGFDTGDTARWSATASDGGDLSVATDAAMKFTTFGLQAFADDTNGLYVSDETPKDETSYRARFYFHPGDFDPGEAQLHRRTRILIGFEEAPTLRQLTVVLRRLSGQYSLRGRVRQNDGTRADTAFIPITAAAHVVEVRWVRASGPGASDGQFELWIDGVSVASLNAIDNDLAAVDFVRLGALSLKTGAAGTLFFDEFESRRETYVGP